MNLSQIQAEAARLLSDKSNDRWPLDVLTTRINFAQTEIQGYTNAVKTAESIALTPNIQTVNIQSGVMDIIYAYKQNGAGEVRPLIGKTRYELDYLYPDWRQFTAGEPQFFFYEETAQRVWLVPAPDAANANTIALYESLKPADLVNPTDIPFDSNISMTPYHYSIIHWVVAHCFMDDGTPEALAKSKFHRSGNMMSPGEYEKELGRIMAEFDSSEIIPSKIIWKPEGARLGYNVWPQKSNPFLY